MTKLICFDVDNTIVKSWTDELLSGVAEWFADLDQTDTRIAFVTNQGGVGLRMWMEQGNWGNPKSLPTIDDVNDRLDAIAEKLGISNTVCILASFAYQSKDGKWSPDPTEMSREWLHNWRKPAPGMIEAAMADHQIFTDVLMVGDSEEDEKASRLAGVKFQAADEFFGR